MKLDALRLLNPNIKILVCLGIINEVQRERISNLISNSTLQSVFSDIVLKFFHTHRGDGMDVDFEFSSVDQSQQFVDFLAHMRAAFDSNYLLTSAASPSEWRASVSYDIPGITKNVDFVNVMTYDMQLCPWPETLGHHEFVSFDH